MSAALSLIGKAGPRAATLPPMPPPRAVPPHTGEGGPGAAPMPPHAVPHRQTSAPPRQGQHSRHAHIEIGQAPPIETELILEPEPDIPPVGDGEPRFRRLQLASALIEQQPRYVDSAPAGDRITFSLNNEEAFIKFWGFTIWNTLSKIGTKIPDYDLSVIETADDEKELAREAAHAFYRMSLDNPSWFGWMRAEATVRGGDWLVVFVFLAAKLSPLGQQFYAKYKKKGAKADD